MTVDRARLDKMARMALFDVPQTQIAKAIGKSDSYVSEIMDTDEFKDILAGISTEYFEQHQQLNDGWNSIEALALTQVVRTLTWSKDPDYALRAAMLANKAQRRGDVVKPIDAQMGARAVINLTANFIQKLQQFGMDQTTPRTVENIEAGSEPPQKDANYMVPEQVEKLFIVPKPKVRRPEDLLKFFPDVNLVPAE